MSLAGEFCVTGHRLRRLPAPGALRGHFCTGQRALALFVLGQVHRRATKTDQRPVALLQRDGANRTRDPRELVRDGPQTRAMKNREPEVAGVVETETVSFCEDGDRKSTRLNSSHVSE